MGLAEDRVTRANMEWQNAAEELEEAEQGFTRCENLTAVAKRAWNMRVVRSPPKWKCEDCGQVFEREAHLWIHVGKFGHMSGGNVGRRARECYLESHPEASHVPLKQVRVALPGSTAPQRRVIRFARASTRTRAYTFEHSPAPQNLQDAVNLTQLVAPAWRQHCRIY